LAMESEMIFILVLALIVLGPRKLPEIGRQLGKALAEFRRAKNEFTAQIEEEVRKIELEEKSKAAPVTSTAEENRILPPEKAPQGTIGQHEAADSAKSRADESGLQGSAAVVESAPGSHA